MTETSETIEFTAATTLQDLFAVTAAQPARRTLFGKAWIRPLLLLGLMLAGVVGGILSSDGDKVEAFKALLTTRIGLQMIAIMVMIALWIWIFGRLWRWVVRAITRRIYADTRRAHPDVDPSSRRLEMRRRYRFDERGMTTSSSADEIWEGWARINGLDETAKLLVVRVGNGAAAYPIPKAELSEELRERLIAYVAARSSSKWPF